MDKREYLLSFLGRETVSPAAKKAAGSIDDLGDSMESTADDAKKLDKEIEQAERALRDLAVQYARADDAAQRLDLTKAMRKQQAEIRRMVKARDLIPPKLGDDAAEGFGARFVGRLGPIITSAPLGPAGAAAGGVVAAAMAPIIGAAISGAVLGGAGVGGVVGGVTLAARDSRVQSASSELAAAIVGDAEQMAGRFVQPTIQGIGIIRSAWADVRSEADESFEAAAGYVVPLARAAAGAAREIAPGFRDAIVAARPVIRELETGIPRLGRAAGGMLTDVSGEADAAAAGIRAMIIAGETAIRVTGTLLTTFAAMSGPVIELGKNVTDAQNALFGWIPVVGDLTNSWETNWNELDQAMKDAKTASTDSGSTIIDTLLKVADASATATAEVKSFQDQLRELRDQTLEVERAEIEFEAKLDEVAAAAKRAKGGIDVHTAAGRENRSMLLDLVSVTKASAQAIKDRTGSDDLAAQATERGRAAFLRAAEAMRVEKGEAKRLADQLFGIPNISRSVKVDTKDARYDVKTLGGLIAAIKNKRVVITVDVQGNTRVRVGGRNVPIGDVGGLSQGGPVDAPGPKGVDSKLYMLARGEHVLTASEVDAAGGHDAIERWRRSLTSGGGAAGTAGAPAGGGGAVTRQVVEHRHIVVLEGTGVMRDFRREIQLSGTEATLGIRAEVVR